MAWTLSGVIGSQLGDVQDMITVEGQILTVQKYIDDSYGFSKDALWYTVLILLGFSIAFWFVVAGKETMLAPLTCLIVHDYDSVALLWAWLTEIQYCKPGDINGLLSDCWNYHVQEHLHAQGCGVHEARQYLDLCT